MIDKMQRYAAWTCGAALLAFAAIKLVGERPAHGLLSPMMISVAATLEVLCAILLLLDRFRSTGWVVLLVLCGIGCVFMVYNWNDARPCGCMGGYDMPQVLRLSLLCLGGVISCWSIALVEERHRAVLAKQ